MGKIAKDSKKGPIFFVLVLVFFEQIMAMREWKKLADRGEKQDAGEMNEKIDQERMNEKNAKVSGSFCPKKKLAAVAFCAL